MLSFKVVSKVKGIISSADRPGSTESCDLFEVMSKVMGLEDMCDIISSESDGHFSRSCQRSRRIVSSADQGLDSRVKSSEYKLTQWIVVEPSHEADLAVEISNTNIDGNR